MIIRIGPTEENILKMLESSINDRLDSAGVFCRVFSRIKSKSSIEKKLKEKQKTYDEESKKMQDVFGIRVTLYFLDDEQIAIDLVKSIFTEIPGSHSIDPITKDYFGPVRKNFVFKIEDPSTSQSALFDHQYIDSSFEVQFRTIFSEGWHEVEHDLRYKCKDDWHDEDLLYRQLNGQLAALETSDWAILKIFDELAYKKYKLKEWNSFFRNILRIRFEDLSFSDEVINCINLNPSVASELLKSDRAHLISCLIKTKSKIPLKMDNVLFLINRALIKNEALFLLEPIILKRVFEESFPIII